LKPERELGRTPLFQVLFALQNVGATHGGDPIDFATGLRASHVGLTGAVQFELSVTISEGLGGLSGMIEYSTELFEDETVARMAKHYLRLLQGAAENPQSEVWRLPLLDEDEQREILDMSGAAEEAIAAGPVSVHELFEQRTREKPEAIALVDGPLQLTYADLNLRANRLVPTLERLGVSRGTLVGVCLKRSADQIVSVLAALKAGAAYLPLSSELPELRLRTMLREARPQVVLTRGDDGVLAAIDDVDVCVVDIEEAVEAAPGENLELVERKAICGEELAYVIFTSGSTGEPKGVAITHGGLASYLEEAVARYGVRTGERVLQFAPLSFDLAAEEIWMTLCTGATLVLRSDEMIGSASAFLRQCQEWRLTVIDLPTAYWHELVT
jgi:non-ribosomal peptide synthetase component F